MSPPLVGVLALQGDVRAHERILTAIGVRVRRIRVSADLDDIDALVLPGGESTTMSNLAVSDGMFEPLREIVKSGRPVYGSCAGLIMLADQISGGRSDQQTIGGLDVVVARNAFGRQRDSFEADLDFPAIGAPAMRAIFIRAPVVTDVGASVEILATLPSTGSIVAVRQGNVFATSFHPELTGDRRVHEYLVAMIGELT